MFAKSFSTLRLISTFPSNIRQFHRLSTASKTLSNKWFFRNCSEIFHKQQVDHITSAGGSIRCFSITIRKRIPNQEMSADKSLNLSYEDLLEVQKDERILIIDVREDSEIKETGKLPGSIHIPMGDVLNVLTNLSNEEFKKKYNKERPNKDTEIVLSCRSGKRSAKVQSELQKLGYKNAFNYAGGWLEWESKQ